MDISLIKLLVIWIVLCLIYLLFRVFKKDSPYKLAKDMISAYKDAISDGCHPKVGLVFAVEAIRKRSFELRTMSLKTDQFLANLFKEKYGNLSENYDEAKNSVVHIVLICVLAYFYPEISPLDEDIRDFEKNELKRQKLETYIRSLL
jgi:hypothetical protein